MFDEVLGHDDHLLWAELPYSFCGLSHRTPLEGMIYCTSTPVAVTDRKIKPKLIGSAGLQLDMYILY